MSDSIVIIPTYNEKAIISHVSAKTWFWLSTAVTVAIVAGEMKKNKAAMFLAVLLNLKMVNNR